MQGNTLQTRAIIFANLFGPPRFVTREEGMELYDAVCESLKLDDINFRYQPALADGQPRSRSFCITLFRSEGRGGFRLEVSNPNPQEPMKSLLGFDWPPSVKHATEIFDMASQCVFKTVGRGLGRVLAEARIRAQCSVAGDSGVSHLRGLMNFDENALASLGGRLDFITIKLGVEPKGPASSPYDDPKRELLIEPLREDKKSVYFELMSQWTQLHQVSEGPTRLDLTKIREIEELPSRYVDETYQFLQENVITLLRRS